MYFINISLKHPTFVLCCMYVESHHSLGSFKYQWPTLTSKVITIEMIHPIKSWAQQFFFFFFFFFFRNAKIIVNNLLVLTVRSTAHKRLGPIARVVLPFFAVPSVYTTRSNTFAFITCGTGSCLTSPISEKGRGLGKNIAFKVGDTFTNKLLLIVTM